MSTLPRMNSSALDHGPFPSFAAAVFVFVFSAINGWFVEHNASSSSWLLASPRRQYWANALTPLV